MTTLSTTVLDGLNPGQREAVSHRGPALLIVAGAGSGKTSVLTRRIALMLANKELWPSQILAITFTNKAAGEMRERVHALIGDAVQGMWISTFHSACVRILRGEADRLGYSKSFTIYDTGDQRALIKRILADTGHDRLGLTPGGVSAKMSRLKNELVDVDGYRHRVSSTDPTDQAFLEVWGEYQNQLSRSQACDFDDLISMTVHLFRAFPDVAATYRKRFRHVLVDEYQDTNHAQYALIRELTTPVLPGELQDSDEKHDTGVDAAALTVVGDSDQSIYAFRGADIRNIVEFERDFPGAHVVLLEQNYRSTQNILDAANAVIAQNFDRKAKNLFSDRGPGEVITGFTGYTQHDEAQFVADEILRHIDSGVSYNQMAVFYRTNAQTRALEEIFIRQAIPYRIIGGTKFYERAEIKDIMAYLTVIANPADTLSMRRILNTPKRGIGPATETALANLAESDSVPLSEALDRASTLGFGPKVSAAIAELDSLLHELRARIDKATPADIMKEVVSRTKYQDLLRQTGNPQDDARSENVDELIAVASEFSRDNAEATLIDFLTDVSLVAAADELDDSQGTVSLMTLHTAKGLEFDAVFVTGCEEQLLPHRMSAGEPGGVAEERRLFYVGMTRARKYLALSLAMSRMTFGDVNSSSPSRFLTDIPENLIAWRETPGLYAVTDGSARRGRFVDREPVALPRAPKKKTEWANRVDSPPRDNSGLELGVGDRIRHTDFGEGRIATVSGEGAKRIAEVMFDHAGKKRLLIKIAPIEKLES